MGESIAYGAVGAFAMMTMALGLAYIVLLIIGRWKVFTKAGEAGWKSIIPIYADYVQWKIAWKKTGLFWIVLIATLVGFAMGFADGSFVLDSNGQMTAGSDPGILGGIGSLIILAAAVVNLIAVYKLFASFGKGAGWFIGYIFLSGIMLIALGFGSSVYQGPRD